MECFMGGTRPISLPGRLQLKICVRLAVLAWNIIKGTSPSGRAGPTTFLADGCRISIWFSENITSGKATTILNGKYLDAWSGRITDRATSQQGTTPTRPFTSDNGLGSTAPSKPTNTLG